MTLSLSEFQHLPELTDQPDIARDKRNGEHQTREEGIL
jgi:hypothetical protein